MRLHSLSACSLPPRRELSFQHHGQRPARPGKVLATAMHLPILRPSSLGVLYPQSNNPQPPGMPCGLETRAGTLLPTARLRPPGPWPAPTWRSLRPSEPLQGSGWTQRGGCFCYSSSRRFAASCNSAWRAGAAAAAGDALQSGPSARP